jgi:hypothetical protein
VNVNGGEDRRDWGTWNYQVQVDVELTPWLSVMALGKLVGRVEQRVAGQDAAFSFWVASAGLGAAL